ncbi:MAG: 7-cyano-7-deazaguanine synthase QueC [Candidatus Cloacimonetes bacterium]|nr:7-cyano-7-deazaguanine synthase QueC [Candidatus Cloacimonadota bacterium]
MKGIVLVSGGMDSLVTAAIADQECDEIYFLHVNYGQSTLDKELNCFYKLEKHYQPKDTLIADIDYLGQIGGSSLTDSSMEITDHDSSEGIPSSYVPFRNANFLSIAASWAEVIKAERIYIGAVEEDSSGYPDCRQSFFQAFEKAINLGTKDTTVIKICTPVIKMNKAEIIRKGLELKAPLQHSWSCYRREDKACGTCDSCVLRINAFKKAGIPDPIPYAINIDWQK